MKNYVTPEVKIHTLTICDVLTSSSPLDFLGIGLIEEEYEGRRINLSDI